MSKRAERSAGSPAAPAASDAADLLGRIIDRDVSAFESLYDRYYRLVFGIAHGMLRDPSAAEDVAQTVFFQLWRQPQAFRGGCFAAWLSRVTRNRCLDELRRPSDVCNATPLADVGIASSFEQDVLASLDAECVRRALARLSENQRIPIEMGFFGGVTYPQIAALQQLPLGTVKTRIRSGLRELYHLLKEAMADGGSRGGPPLCDRRLRRRTPAGRKHSEVQMTQRPENGVPLSAYSKLNA